MGLVVYLPELHFQIYATLFGERALVSTCFAALSQDVPVAEGPADDEPLAYRLNLDDLAPAPAALGGGFLRTIVTGAGLEGNRLSDLDRDAITFSDALVLVVDGDERGQRAARRAYETYVASLVGADRNLAEEEIVVLWLRKRGAARSAASSFVVELGSAHTTFMSGLAGWLARTLGARADGPRLQLVEADARDAQSVPVLKDALARAARAAVASERTRRYLAKTVGG